MSINFQTKGNKVNKQLAKITSARLQIKERGILNFLIQVNYEEGTGQGIGGIALDQYSKEKDSRIGTAYGCEMIRRILLCLDVNDFSEMAGMHIWVYGDGHGFSFQPKGIARLNVDGGENVLIFDDVAKEFIEGE